MKKNVLVIAGLAVLSTSAFASKARMEALGQGTVSRYIMDSRSVFLNPAMVNEQKNYIITEWGTSTAANTTAAPRAEGGFFREMGTFSYGLYLGNDDSRIAHDAAGAADFIAQSNALDLFVGGDMGMKWGAKVHYANTKNETGKAEHNALGLGLGVSQGDFEAYANIDLTDKATGTVTAGVSTQASYESKLKPSYTIGGSYKLEGWSVFAQYDASKLESTQATATTTKNSTIIVGAGRLHEVNPGARLFTDLTLSMGTVETSAGKVTTNKLPATLGMEVDATSWLVVRGSIAQNIILGSVKQTTGKTDTIANSTLVNAGATLNFGKLKADGMIGTTGTTGTAGSQTGVLSTSNLLTRVGVTYSF